MPIKIKITCREKLLISHKHFTRDNTPTHRKTKIKENRKIENGRKWNKVKWGKDKQIKTKANPYYTFYIFCDNKTQSWNKCLPTPLI